MPSTSPGNLRVAAAQLENAVGDLPGNRERILDAMAWAEEQEADLLLLPELALTGYPLEDLAVRKDFVEAAGEALAELAAASGRTATIVGVIDPVPPRRSWDTRPRDVAIGAAILCDGEVRGIYHKVLLPNYAVFDEARSFAPGTLPGAVWRIGEAVAGISICEDSWSGDGPPELQAAAGAQLLLSQNASPFQVDKAQTRLEHCRALARRNGLPVVYVNCVGGQDELVFDGGSLAVGADGELLALLPQFEPARSCFDLPLAPSRHHTSSPRTVHARPARLRSPLKPEAAAAQVKELGQIWSALVLGTRDFARRNGTSAAVLGLSGGIDAAVTAAVAADALGPENVLGLSMPTARTVAHETANTRELASNLGIALDSVELDEVLDAIKLTPAMQGRPEGGVRRGLLARMRGAMVQAVAHELGRLALATVNKTELSLGSATLFGDIAGAFAPLKDCQKTLLYQLARHRNARGAPIPRAILERLPTSLVDEVFRLSTFAEIDPIITRRLELGEREEEIVAAGHDARLVRGILQLIDSSELARRQSPPGVKITARAFGTDRRMPITNAWRPFTREQEEIAPDVDGGPVPDSATHSTPA